MSETLSKSRAANVKRSFRPSRENSLSNSQSWIRAEEGMDGESDELVSDSGSDSGSESGSEASVTRLRLGDTVSPEGSQSTQFSSGSVTSSPVMSMSSSKKTRSAGQSAVRYRGQHLPYQSSNATTAGQSSELIMPVLDYSTPSQGSPRQRKVSTQRSQHQSLLKEQKHAPKHVSQKRHKHAADPAPGMGSRAWSATHNTFWEVLSFAGRVLKQASHIIQPLASWLLAGLIVYAILTTTYGLARRQAINAATRSFCSIPLVPMAIPSICAGSSSRAGAQESGILPPADFDRLMASNAHMEEILAAKSEQIYLPAIMKRSEASVRDLRSLVSVSTLKSRKELKLEFDMYIETSRLAVRDLTRFNSRVDAAADSILHTSRWTRRVLDEIEVQRVAAGPSYDQASLAGRLWGALTLRGHEPTFEERVRIRYLEHAETVEDRIHGLLLEAEALFQILNNLDNRLDVIGEIAARDGGIAAAQRREVLASLWTKLGRNRSRVARFDSELAILRQVDLQRRTAIDQVGRTVVQLREMEAELHGLRDRLGETRLAVGGDDGAAAVGSGSAKRNVPIGVHLENIEKGVERLERSRDQARNANDKFRSTAQSGAAWDAIAGADGKGAGVDKDRWIEAGSK